MTVYDGQPFIAAFYQDGAWVTFVSARDPRIIQLAIAYALGTENEDLVIRVEKKLPDGKVETCTGIQFMGMRPPKN